MDGYRRQQLFFQDRSKDVEILTGTEDYASSLVPRNAFHILYIQRIVLAISTHAADKVITFQDQSTTPLQFGAHTDKAAGAGVLDEIIFDFGPDGKACGVGKAFDILQSAAGIGGNVHIDAYERPMDGISAAQMIA